MLLHSVGLCCVRAQRGVRERQVLQEASTHVWQLAVTRTVVIMSRMRAACPGLNTVIATSSV
jgi:hypothetical protein